MYVCSSRTEEARGRAQGQAWLHSEFEPELHVTLSLMKPKAKQSIIINYCVGLLCRILCAILAQNDYVGIYKNIFTHRLF